MFAVWCKGMNRAARVCPWQWPTCSESLANELSFGAGPCPGHWDVPFSRPPKPSPRRPSGNSTWMSEWSNNSQLSFSFTCIFAPKRTEWPPKLTVDSTTRGGPEWLQRTPCSSRKFPLSRLLRGAARGLTKPPPPPPQLEQGWPSNQDGPAVPEPRKATQQASESDHRAPALTSCSQIPALTLDQSTAFSELLSPEVCREDDRDAVTTGFRTGLWPEGFGSWGLISLVSSWLTNIAKKGW